MSDYLFPRGKRPFTEIYPDIEELELVVKILNSGGNEQDEKIYSNTTLPVNGVNCDNPVCKNGGLSINNITSAISKIYKNKDSEHSEHIFCNGERYKGASCGWGFKLLLKAKYNKNSNQ